MKRNFCLTLALTAASFAVLHAQQTAEITSSGIGYLQYLPDGYKSNSNRYPVVISLHGVKEKGTSSKDPELVMKDLPRVAYVGLPKYVKLGQKYPFILISPQLKSQYGSWPPDFIIEVINHVKKGLRIDEKRIYLTGLSLGGLGVWKTAGAYPKVFAAIAPICPGGNALDKAHVLAAENVAAWGFHGTSDHIVSYAVTANMINAMNTAPKKPNPLAKMTLFQNMGHNVWDRAYQQTNVLDWMLSFRNGTTAATTSEPNIPPVADAGADITVNLPTNAVTVRGKGSDSDGKITAYKWTQVAGAGARLSGTSSADLKASDLKEGEYVFKLSVQDNDGASASDAVTVKVKAAVNKSPKVDAGADRTITLPANSIALQGTASDTDGQVVSYKWTKISGGEARLSDAASRECKAFDLTQGNYVFRLTVKDDDGASAHDDITVTVNKAQNKLPIVNAGTDRTITLPDNTVTLQGTASDPDGEVVAYTWTKLSGGVASLSGADGIALTASGLSEGNYVFRLSVEDNSGAAASAQVEVTVKKGTADQYNKSPVVSAGPDKTIRLPENSTVLRGSADDEDGTIASYKWSQISGQPSDMADADSRNARVSGLGEGTYVFRFTATDNLGASSADEVTFYVVRGMSPSIQPVDYPGVDRSSNMPYEVVTPRGSSWYEGD